MDKDGMAVGSEVLTAVSMKSPVSYDGTGLHSIISLYRVIVFNNP
jgi:hypothetical protein